MVNGKIHPRQTFNQLKYLSRWHLTENKLKIEEKTCEQVFKAKNFVAFMMIKKIQTVKIISNWYAN